MAAWIAIFCIVPILGFVYGWVMAGKRFVSQQLPVLAGFFVLVTAIEIAFNYYGIAGLRLLQLLMTACIVPWMVVHANEYVQQKDHSFLTKVYVWLFPELQSLSTVKDKLTAIRRARWKLLERPATALGVCSWYIFPWLLFHTLVKGQSIPVIVISTACVLLFLFAGMHFTFRRPIRQHLVNIT